jgi:P4 family phage/plasmid primase-like protien
MRQAYKNYKENEIISFTVNIKQKENKSNNVYKKEISFPKGWTSVSLESNLYNANHNSIAILTGEKNGIFVLDIDNVKEWEELLKEQNKKEPATVKVKSGSGGIHYYFKYTKDLEIITSKDHAIKHYSIDVKTNGGCVIAPPSKYFNKNLNKEVEYVWEYSIFDYEMIEMPEWIKELLMEKHGKQHIKQQNELKKSLQMREENEESKENALWDLKEEEKINEEEINTKYEYEEIEYLLSLLNKNRYENYKDWIDVGMMLKNVDTGYKILWKKWSKQSEKYDSDECDEKWKGFKKDKKGLSIGSLLYWCNQDNKEEYVKFQKNKKINAMVVSKFPKEKLVLKKSIKNGEDTFIELENNKCLIKGDVHSDMENTMYLHIMDKIMSIRCKHAECFGKTYCQHRLTSNEVKIFGNVNVTINNNGNDNEYIEFQKIDLYETEEINELVYNGLSCKPFYLAELIYHFYKDEYIFGEDNEWYSYKNNKWVKIGNKNTKLRLGFQSKLKELYKELYKYYKEDEKDTKKMASIKKIIDSFGETTLKNNIMTELIDLYMEQKNPERDFTKKLDTNNNLLGFENGVYDLEKMEFRKGKQCDYISMSTNYDYIEKHTENYKDLEKFLEDIQANKEERDYMLTYLSIGLIGNKLELFTILTGCGRNGKSKLIELLKITFGDYFGSTQSQMFTRPRPDANNPDPGLLSLSKKRIVIASEPEKNSKLNSGFIKFITGRDSTTLRNCHSNDMIDFSPKFITLLICNDIPDCDDIDNAFSKRLRCINFNTEFVDEPINENQKKIDTNINQKFDLWKQDFMLLLIEYYKKYTETKKLKVTENILKWTNQYKEDTDMYLQFLNECTNNNIHCTIIYTHFKDWFKNTNPNMKIPNYKDFLCNIKKHKNISKTKINGIPQAGIKNIKMIE